MNKKVMLFAAGLAASTATAWAYDEPGVNLGGTSFFDGGGMPGGPGLYFIEYLTYYSANKLMDNSGNKLAFPPGQKSDLTVPVSQLIYAPEDAKWGDKQIYFQVVLPWMAQAHVDDGLNNAVLKARTGIGDLGAGVSLQFNPVMGEHGPLFSQRFELQVIAPAGHYDRNAAVNPGSNFWSFDPYWAFTVWISPKFSISGRINYLWNGKNKDPNVAFGPGVTSTQAGQALHGNFAAGYQVNQDLVVGLSGYWLKQITDTKVNGSDVPGRREQVWALGPAAMVTLSPKDLVFFNYYKEFAVHNRAEGNRFQIRYDHHF